MIACENEDCSREWVSRLCRPLLPLSADTARTQFHLECVGLDKAPDGVWYCDDCVRDLNLDPRTFKPQ